MDQRTVLFVDDDSDMRDFVFGYLSRAGYRVLCASDVPGGLKLALENRPDIVLTDVMMPKESGYSLCKKLRENREMRQVPIVITTALLNDSSLAFEAGAVAFLPKPIKAEQLLKTIQEILEEPHARSQLRRALEMTSPWHEPEPSPHDKDILLVEDERIVARDLETRLRKLGYSVCGSVGSGEAAILKAEETRPGVVLMDIRLEGRMDGIEAAGVIRNRFDIPVIFLTASADHGSLQRAKESEPYAYILKPFDERELQIAVEIALYRHRVQKWIKKSEQWLSTVLNSIGDAVLTTDELGRLTFMNPVAESLTGWSLSQSLGKNLTDIFELSPLKSTGMEGTLTGSDGVERPIEYSRTPLWNGGGLITGYVIVFRDITSRRRYELKLTHLANHDPLTGLFNRRRFLEDLERQLASARRYGSPGAVLFVDLDDFKTINDRMGHQAGDQMLISLTDLLRKRLRGTDSLGRLGGDEFAYLLAHANISQAQIVAEGLLQEIRGHSALFNGEAMSVTASIGIAVFPDHGVDLNEILSHADSAMYSAKGKGGDCCFVFRSGGDPERKSKPTEDSP